MDYETSDGSQFSLREIWTRSPNSNKKKKNLNEDDDDDNNDPDTLAFECTLITAFVDGHAYAGKSLQRMNSMDDVDVINYLSPVPPGNIFPLMPPNFTRAPPFDMSQHYLKAPQFTYEDARPGQTFVADRLRSEACVLELLMQHGPPHASIVRYFGCVVNGEGRITHLCLQRGYCTLAEYYAAVGLAGEEKERLLEQVKDGLKYLHKLGLAHNDVNPGNICVDATGSNAMLVDFDSCAPFGAPLAKGVAVATTTTETEIALPISDKQNDYQAFKKLVHFLKRDRKNLSYSACYPPALDLR